MIFKKCLYLWFLNNEIAMIVCFVVFNSLTFEVLHTNSNSTDKNKSSK